LSVYQSECMNVCLLLGDGDVFFGVSSFGSVARQRLNNEIMRSFAGSVPRKRPTGNNRVVFSLESVLGARCRRDIVLVIQPDLRKG
jgi:hypothetical protein